MALIISGAQAAVSLVNRALFNTSPSNSVYLNQVANAGTSADSEYAFANKLGASLGNKSAADLTALLFANLGLNDKTVNPESLTILQAAVTDYIAFHGTQNIGIIALQLGQILSTKDEDATFGAAAKAWNQEVVGAYEYSVNPANKTSQTGDAVVGNSINLTVGQDSAVGTGGDDVFTARIFDNQNTLQSGDRIEGGAGNDTLKADIGSSQKFAITPELNSVERVEIRVQADQTDSGDNNIAGVGIIDAERSVGVNHWESNNSRADLIIEDVRIGASQITKDITIAFVESDPGHVDMGVYFDQYSLRSQTNTSSVLSLEVLDTRSAAAGTGPLKDSPYHGVAFNVTFPGATTPKLITLTSQAIDDAQTYEALVAAIQAALDANPELAGFKASLGGSFQVFDTLGSPQTGSKVLITTNTGATVSAEGAGTGWIANGAVPPSSGLHTNISNSTTNNTDLVTSKIILDDVGRGSTGGDLVVGGLSVGDTSTSKGVGRFEIEVRDNSKLQTISSTNNSLKEVVLKNGVTTSNSFAYVDTKKDAGNLTVNGVVGVAAADNSNAALPGSTSATGAKGFTDVRLIDGSAMTGKLEFTAAITEASIAKYLNLKDVAGAQPAADNISFEYKGGAGNDKIDATIDSQVAASRTLSAREDFKFTVEGGGGNDELIVKLTGSDAVTGAPTAIWLADQQQLNNVFINGGEGNDIIRKPGSGNAIINAGAGDDTVYSDNIAAKAAWVFNSVNTLTTDLQGVVPAAGTATQFLYKGVVNVTFGGFAAKADVPTGDNYAVTQLQINQAIKKAINEDAVLSKLFLAEDGPASTLVVKSLIDGAPVAVGDLGFSVTAAAVSGTELALANAAFLKFQALNPTSTSAAGGITTADGANAVTVAEKSAVAKQLASDFTGADSLANTDNVITMGAGNDVVVLSSSALAEEKLVYTGYDLGKDSIVNFTPGVAGAGVDKLDFSAYLTSKATAAAVLPIATTLNNNDSVEANSVTILSGTAFTTADTFAGLTAAKLMAALNAGGPAYAGLAAATLNGTAAGFAGDGKAVVLVENTGNVGEYAAFELTFTAASAGEFTAVKAIGVLDFGVATALDINNLS